MPEENSTPSVESPDQPQDHGLPSLTPDTIEQEKGERIDNIVPTEGFSKLPVVGLGGSAGGLAALQSFFGAMPPDTGMAFVVIMHLSPEHESILAEVLQRSTSMLVRQVRDSLKVEPNQVYVIPPAKHLSMADGHLHLSEPARARPGKHVAVDLFFRTLADTHGPRAAAIVFSGADGDGAIGTKRIKERGGLTVAQDPAEAEMDSMPRAAIATGMVDWVLPAAEMPARLQEYWRTEQRLRLPPEKAPEAAQGHPDEMGEAALHDILSFLRARTGRDFSYYKRATILRRIARRMQVNGIEEPQGYLAFLRTHPGETGALLQDLLISVTNFFRDRESFAALEAAIPTLFRGKGPNDTIRVWSAACATGEEAYSIAMLLSEHAGTLDHPPKIQVFATDLDESAIQAARDGTYPETISADVSEERLRRFFVKGQGHYRVKRDMREVVLFALHDLLKDSPFSKLDLMSCRNLLIYLSHDAQERALDIFHFALNPDGILFLGSSESVDEASALFVVTDKKHRLYARRTVARTRLPNVFTGPSAQTRAMLRRDKEGPVLPKASSAPPEAAGTALPLAAPGSEAEALPWEIVHARALGEFGPPSMIVNQEYELVHLSGDAGRFLRFTHGEPATNLMRLVHPMLRIELRAALFRATQASETTETRGVPVEIEGEHRVVDLRVVPTLPQAPGFLLVVLTERESTAEPASASGIDVEPAVRELEREMESLKARLRDTVEQSDASEEELKASNEELQAMNEELRSTSEELETGREELQSINEELTTVNGEMKSKVDELGRSNSDLQNLMAATEIATVFLDRHLCIERYTPPAVALFHLIPTDVGRPLGDLTSRIIYPDLISDAERVLADLAPVEREVSHPDGSVFIARVRPYRGEHGHIAGVLLTFVDITERKRGEAALAESESRLAADLAGMRRLYELQSKLAQLTDFQAALQDVLAVACEFTGTDRGCVQLLSGDGQRLEMFVWQGYAEDSPFISFFRYEGFEQGGEVTRVQRQRLIIEDTVGFPGLEGTDAGAATHAEGIRAAQSTPMTSRTGETLGVVSTQFRQPHRPSEHELRLMDMLAWTAAEFIERQRADAALRESEERLRLVVENAREYAIFSLDLDRCITSWNSGAQEILGYATPEAVGKSGDMIFTEEDRVAGAPEKEAQGALANGRAADERWHQRKDGSRFWGSGVMMAMRDAQGDAIGLVKIFRDQTAELHAKEALERSREELWTALKETERARAEAEAAGHAKDHFLAVLSHELRTPLTPVLMGVHLLGRMRNLPASARDALQMIERNVQIEAHFIDDLLDLTKIARGKLEIVREPMDLHQAVQHAVEITTADMEAKAQQLTLELAATEHALRGDATRLQQAFWNLLKNASKFTPNGGSIHITSRNEPGWVIVEISDTGIGFDAEVATRIFEAFTQASREVTQKFGGLGLGLAISKATVDVHGGTLRARSDGHGHGATFTVELPLSAERD